ncbi:MazF family transcriptional regulator [Methylobacterium variabile]|jgi:mRNA interferase MazF|uniref:MazF family transcriptional regulator n=1 Tax=Methylobacterium variabile TaxID=298794 RepID=A0A0J6SW65_9HYPH|nr:type II toxin-antitoxin system PemK/MazF family toxin [Methylobacterium variabile]KMO37959.1 MazF family transcriptional regulator [Methylobacterium variabile]
MIHTDPLPRPGDLVLIDLAPAKGTEQDRRRPALVVSEAEMHLMARRAVICPATRNVAPWPTEVFLPPGLGAEGAVLVDQVRAIDRRERILRMLGAVHRRCSLR